MTNPPMEMLVFKDGEGHYYVLPRQAWEQARVPDERRHEVEQLLAGGAKSATKVADLPPRDVASVQGAAVSAQAVGSFRTTSPVGKRGLAVREGAMAIAFVHEYLKTA